MRPNARYNGDHEHHMAAEQRERMFREAFDAHADELFRHARARLSDHERARELVQETFLRTWNYLVLGGEIERYRPFLFRTLSNLIIDEYRKHKTVSLDRLLEEDETGVEAEGSLLRDEYDLLEEMAVSFEATAALEGLTKLPPRDQAVVTMRFIDGLSPREIAEALGETENAISVRLHRGIRKLRAILTSSLDIPS